MAKTKTATLAEFVAFMKALVEAKRASNVVGSVLLRDLDGAVDLLWSGYRKGRARMAAMAEVDLATRGQAFRLETEDGPLFEEETLWKFAGRSGNEWAKGPDVPTWPARQSLRRAA